MSSILREGWLPYEGASGKVAFLGRDGFHTDRHRPISPA